MDNKSVWHIKPQGSTLQRAIINTLNFITDIVFDTIVKPNQEKTNNNTNQIVEIDKQITSDNETLLDMAYELDTVKDDNAELNEGYLDLDYRLSLIEDKEEA